MTALAGDTAMEDVPSHSERSEESPQVLRNSRRANEILRCAQDDRSSRILFKTPLCSFLGERNEGLPAAGFVIGLFISGRWWL